MWALNQILYVFKAHPHIDIKNMDYYQTTNDHGIKTQSTVG